MAAITDKGRCWVELRTVFNLAQRFSFCLYSICLYLAKLYIIKIICAWSCYHLLCFSSILIQFCKLSMSLAAKLENTWGSGATGSGVLRPTCSYDIRQIKRFFASYWSCQSMVDKRKIKVMRWNFLSRWLAIRKKAKIFVKISMGSVIFKSTFACEYNGLAARYVLTLFSPVKHPVVEWGETVVFEEYLLRRWPRS